MTARTFLRMPVTMRRLNDAIWEGLDNGRRSEAVAFFCECARHGCYRPVWLTPGEYEESRRRPEWVALAPGHREATAR